MSNEQTEFSHENLTTAIRAYVADTDNEAYVSDWVLITHRLTPELVNNDQSQVTVSTGKDQSWVVTRGLIEAARDLARRRNS